VSALASSDLGATMTIGEVLALLRPDFSDISISKIRFLEGEGLVSPQRAPSGYRRFSGADVDRLRLVLVAQRDHFLPLRIIKEKLQAGELEAYLFPEEEPAPENPQPEVQVETLDPVAPQPLPEVDPQGRFSLREAARESGLPLDDLKELVSFGVLQIDAGERLSGAQVLLCRAYAVLSASGVDHRHLRQVKNSASRDASLISQSVPHLRAAERGDAEQSLLQAFSEAHYWLVVAELDRLRPSHR